MIHPSRNNRTPAHAGRTKTGPLLAASLGILFSTTLFPLPVLAAELPHHEITVTLDPGRHRLEADDTITLPKGSPREIRFSLHAGLKPAPVDKKVRISGASAGQGPVPLETFVVTLPKNSNRFTIRYAGTIEHPLVVSRSQARGMDQTPGTIAEEGVYLAGSSAWYPLLDAGSMTFSLSIELPGHGTR